MAVQINADLEMVEVTNAFPVILEFLTKLDVMKAELREGESVEAYFQRQNLRAEEIAHLIRKMNQELRHFFSSETVTISSDSEIETLY